MALINRLRKRGGGSGVAAICGGFGQGDALMLEVA
jgi:acetyl-CoA C-acetyltransferase